MPLAVRVQILTNHGNSYYNKYIGSTHFAELEDDCYRIDTIPTKTPLVVTLADPSGIQREGKHVATFWTPGEVEEV